VFTYAVADEERAVGQPRDVGRPGEVLLVVAGNLEFAERHHKLAVAREVVNGVRAVVHEPDVPLGIVRAHENAMRPDEQLVVLFPRLDHLPAAIDDVEDVVPARMPLCVLLREIVAGRVAARHQIAVVADVLHLRQAAAVEDVHAIGCLGPGHLHV
jgi:hypothetical protein